MRIVLLIILRLENYIQINRSNMIVDSIISSYTYTSMHIVIKHAKIEMFSSISWGISISEVGHNYEYISPHPFIHLKAFGFIEENEKNEISEISIGNDVWIDVNSCILSGCYISNGAVIGAGSVVTKNVSDYAIIVRNPVRIIKYRFLQEVIQLLDDLC